MQPSQFTNKALESAICPQSKTYLYVKDPKTLGLSAVVTKGSKSDFYFGIALVADSAI